MNDLWDRIERNKKGWKLGMILYLIFNGCFMFPYRTPSDPYFSVNNNVILPIMVYVMTAPALYGIEKNAHIKIFILVFGCTGIGLIGRIALEWGQSSMIRDLTMENVLIFLIGTSLATTLTYTFCKYLDEK